jgi:hypothetical protein
VDELSDGLVKGLSQRRSSSFAELEAMLGLEEDMAAALRDRAEVIHLLPGLSTDLLDDGGVQTEGDREGNPCD